MNLFVFIRRVIFLVFCLVIPTVMMGQKDAPIVSDVNSSTWVVGSIVEEAEVNHQGIDRYFVSERISDDVFARMQDCSYRKGCPVSREQLRYLKVLHRNAEGKNQLGEMVCNVIIADKLLRVFRALYEAGYRIEQMRLIDDYEGDDDKSMSANNTSSFNYRHVSGTTTVSKHGYGLAIDINPRYNPYVKTRNGVTIVEPLNGKKYAFNRTNRTDIPYKIDRSDLAYKLLIKEGFIWGGAWRSVKDYQHFEYRGNQ